MDVTVIDEARALEIEANSVVAAEINAAGQLVFTRGDASTFNGGKVVPDPIASFPVGSIYISVSPTNPATALKGGVWSRFANGRVLVGVDEGDPLFDTVEELSGSKTHTITVAQMPNHAHGGMTGDQDRDHSHTGYTSTDGAHAHNYSVRGSASPIGTGNNTASGYSLVNGVTDTQGSHSHSVQTYGANQGHLHPITAEGGGQAINIVQPSITVYIWKRTA